MRKQAAVVDELHQEFGNRFALQRFTGRALCEPTRDGVQLDVITCAHAFRLGADEGAPAEVDRVAIEEPGERLGDERRYAEILQRLRCLLTRGAGAEVATADDDVALAYARSEAGIDRFHAVFCHLGDLELEIAAGRYGVRVDVVAEDPRPHCSMLRGSAMRPATADAATV